MDNIRKTLEGNLDKIYVKITNPDKRYIYELNELKKETSTCKDILRLSIIKRRVDNVNKILNPSH
jgi:hypothetical protein